MHHEVCCEVPCCAPSAPCIRRLMRSAALHSTSPANASDTYTYASAPACSVSSARRLVIVECGLTRRAAVGARKETREGKVQERMILHSAAERETYCKPVSGYPSRGSDGIHLRATSLRVTPHRTMQYMKVLRRMFGHHSVAVVQYRALGTWLYLIYLLSASSPYAGLPLMSCSAKTTAQTITIVYTLYVFDQDCCTTREPKFRK